MRKNLIASILVFLVALPLCLGIAVASGVAPEKGIISGFIGGVVVGALGGAPLQVSGPANSLIVVVWDAVSDIGLTGLAVSIFLAGLLQIMAGLSGGGRLARFFPPAVTQGLMTGFAAMIFASQAHVMIDAKPGSSFLNNIEKFPEELWNIVAAFLLGDLNWGAVFGISSLILMIGLGSYQSKMSGVWKKIPAALFVVILFTVISMLTHVDLKRVHVPDSIVDDFSLPNIDLWLKSINITVIEVAFTIFILASSESLLSAAAIDSMKPGHSTKYDRELVAQGVGNLLCSVLGALPVAGVVIRSTANITSGATSRLSSILHGVWLLAMVGLFPFVIDDIPLSILGAILVFSVIRLVNPRAIAVMAQNDRWAWPMFVISALTVLFVNPMAGVAVGLAMHFIQVRLARYNFSKLRPMLQPIAERKRLDQDV